MDRMAAFRTAASLSRNGAEGKWRLGLRAGRVGCCRASGVSILSGVSVAGGGHPTPHLLRAPSPSMSETAPVEPPPR